MPAITVSIINLKGGVGKSTLAMLLSEFLVFWFGQRVLLIDMDAQGNLSYIMVPEAQIGEQTREHRTIYDLLKLGLAGRRTNIDSFITKPPFVVSNVARSAATTYPGTIDMVISTPAVAQLDEDLMELWEAKQPMPDNLRMSLAEALEPSLDEYDYVLIDCPPGLSIFSSTALMASNFYISPVIPEPLSLQGVDLVQRRVAELSEKYGHRTRFMGVVLNIVKHYRNTHRRVADLLYSTNQDQYQPFRFWIPDSERLRKIGEFDPDLPGSWGGGVGAKFASLLQKYAQSFVLTNPKAGLLSRTDVEGPNYKLEDRIHSLVEEFRERCQ